MFLLALCMTLWQYQTFHLELVILADKWPSLKRLICIAYNYDSVCTKISIIFHTRYIWVVVHARFVCNKVINGRVGTKPTTLWYWRDYERKKGKEREECNVSVLVFEAAERHWIGHGRGLMTMAGIMMDRLFLILQRRPSGLLVSGTTWHADKLVLKTCTDFVRDVRIQRRFTRVSYVRIYGHQYEGTMKTPLLAAYAT